ncbi:hypothetical protein PRIC1_013532 [Phytophthora ramorum]|uniref:Bifunctional adenosine 5'-phosphosulfate phosphorylase/adenylylsulfatase HINT4 n=1 Tax=Phytophthora ramorum TaxID=164328 RepID=UPI003096224E|nr:Bifunctional adenosine 5'-phosphosulfate phosphorylase/adenylylsulfatase HINT4 [Phytophthora ramorum]KAH7500658.1 Bifunctional adenosine 5'-phosphosulfate phosphorylase/adenylylsulfatase HINT4 [Phytophthora ramorum]
MWGARACTFCCETLRARNHIVYEDARVIAMLDHNPRATKHVLVIPHEHIPSVDDLTPAHYDLLEHMLTTGKEVLARDGFVDKENCRFGFHRSPFASVPHLHMHCLGMPFLPVWNRLRFTESMLPSYISAEGALAALRIKCDTPDITSSSED